MHATHVPLVTPVPAAQLMAPATHAVLLAFADWPAGQAVHTASVALPPGLVLLPVHATHVPLVTPVPAAQLTAVATHAVLLLLAAWPAEHVTQTAVVRLPPGLVELELHATHPK